VGKVETRWPTAQDVADLVRDLRDADRAELVATIGEDVDAVGAMQYVVEHSSHAWSIVVNGRLSMIGGLFPMSNLLCDDAAQPWMMATKTMERMPGTLMRVGLRYLQVMRGCYPRLSNHVDARNTRSIRWLKRIGFTVHDHTVPFGPYGLPFHPFEMNS
jgi:hypothetical protein